MIALHVHVGLSRSNQAAAYSHRPRGNMMSHVLDKLSDNGYLNVHHLHVLLTAFPMNIMPSTVYAANVHAAYCLDCTASIGRGIRPTGPPPAQLPALLASSTPCM